MKVLIERVNNGWVVSYKDEELGVTKTVHQFDFDEHWGRGATLGEVTAVEAFQSALYEVMELVGPTTSKYSRQRLRFEIHPGDDYVDGSETEEEE